MARGNYDRQKPYLRNPHINKPIAEIYADLDAFTWEIFEDQPHRFDTVSFYVLLPPLFYEGKFIKGIYFSEAVELINKLFPGLSSVFHSFTFVPWIGYSWAPIADAYSSLYTNPQRDKWFRETYPDRAHKPTIPLQDCDFINEYWISPRNVPEKDIDLLAVARISEEKNLPIIAKALKIYRQKHPQKPIKLTILSGHDFDVNNINSLDESALNEWRQIETILTNPFDYINLLPRVDYYNEMPAYYSRAKAFVLGSLLEGKNRAIMEAMSCNIPVICFQEFNQYARGNAPVFPEGAGLYAKFDPESLADTIYTVLENRTEFKPRYQYLKHCGRKNFFNTCIDSFPYYQHNIPDYKPGDVVNNLWLDLAVQQNYQVSLNSFLYGGSHLSHLRGINAIQQHLGELTKFIAK
ncbi:glycosyltransferase [Microcoleus sp.]|uniref:glycosyltransferase n=1 Tax=Microcoleus sp. TaxID=44472 RepID=UPI00352335BB